jgi:excinuclease ABC subunit A
MEHIKVHGAKVHNLKNVSVQIPRNKITVITGPSGSGKSSLAFDTIYAEGQRRYIESLSSYARQFLGQMEPPDVESIEGLSPAIAIDQKSTSKNPRSTVGTITEVYDYMRLLWARLAQPHCPETGDPVGRQTPQQIVERILILPQGSKLQFLSPVIRQKKGEHREEIQKFLSLGYLRARHDGEMIELTETTKLHKAKSNNLELVIDRIVLKPDSRSRVTEAVEQSLKLSDGFFVLLVNDDELFFSEKNFSPKTNRSYPDLEPRLFSFNSPLGACNVCNGLGHTKTFTEEKILFDSSLSLEEGAMPVLSKSSFLLQMVRCVAKSEKVALDTPFKKLPDSFKNILLRGTSEIYTYKFESENSTFNFKKEFPGILSWLEKKYFETESEKVKLDLEEYMEIKCCHSCQGLRLNPYALHALLDKKSIMQIAQLPLSESARFFQKLVFEGSEAIIAQKLLKEIKNRLHFLLDVGLDYLTLNREASTLSGGESQRIRLATQIGSALSGVLYVLDEPSIGLHQRDNLKLIKTLKSLRDIGNTVIVVEHDEETMMSSDWLIDMGPAAGIHGGEIVAQGTPQEVVNQINSVTAQYLSGKRKVPQPQVRRKAKGYLQLNKAQEHNLKSVTFKIPVGTLTCLTGVSGSGKSTLVHKILTPALRATLNGRVTLGTKNYHSLLGSEHFQSLIELDQSPIGRTPHSNPATYTGLFDDIRNVFSQTNESKVRGYKPGRFSFNVKGGRCDTCEGNGSLKIEMHFLPDVFITCHECNGSRYNKETLNILYRGKNISDVLNMSIEEAVVFFENYPKIHRALKVLNDVGLSYLKLGQPATTLSGGEAQRLKLSRELSKSTRGKTLYILDEPTTGLHFEDIRVLLEALNKLVDQGHTLLVIEHNLDVIRSADWIVDLGPEGGDKGGQIVAEGSPEDIKKAKESITGKYI